MRRPRPSWSIICSYFSLSGPSPTHQGRKRPADAAFGLGEGVDEDVRPLQVAQHANIEEVDGILARIYRLEIAVVDAVVDAFRTHARLADAGGVDASCS